VISTLHENCNPQEANNTKLPYTSYLIWYKVEDQIRYDIAMGDKQVDVFDAYWDKYGKDGFIGMKQSEGRVQPNRWNVAPPPPKKRKRRKRKEEPEDE
tara:strand:+ start:135 stop:428 length:294 start_codon:yes stop_codon:yes gene_type:complete